MPLCSATQALPVGHVDTSSVYNEVTMRTAHVRTSILLALTACSSSGQYDNFSDTVPATSSQHAATNAPGTSRVSDDAIEARLLQEVAQRASRNPQDAPRPVAQAQSREPAPGEATHSIDEHPWAFMGSLVATTGNRCEPRHMFSFGPIASLGSNDSRCRTQNTAEQQSTTWTVVCPLGAATRSATGGGSLFWNLSVSRTPRVARDGRTPIYPATYAHGAHSDGVAIGCTYEGWVIARQALAAP
jgi:hypothetical protein